MVPRISMEPTKYMCFLACCLVCWPFLTLLWPSVSLLIFLVDSSVCRFNQKRVNPENQILKLVVLYWEDTTNHMAALIRLSCWSCLVLSQILRSLQWMVFHVNNCCSLCIILLTEWGVHEPWPFPLKWGVHEPWPFPLNLQYFYLCLVNIISICMFTCLIVLTWS